MKKSRFTDEQIIGFLKQVEGGVPVKDLCRKHGFSDATFYKWRSRLGGLDCKPACNSDQGRCGRRLGLVKQRFPTPCGARLGCGIPARS